MIRLTWAALLIGGPHLFFAQPEAVVLSVVIAFLLWSVTAADRDHWRRVARMRHVRRPGDALTGSAPWLPRGEAS